MLPAENVQLWCVPHLNNLNLLRATFVTYSFKRHMHDYFVIGMIEAGLQRFAYQRDTYITPPTGLIVINPGEPHTGEAAAEAGFRYRALYPEASVMQAIAEEIDGHHGTIPFFPQPVIHDRELYENFRNLHVTLENAVTTLEYESLYLWTLAQLVIRHADPRPQTRNAGREKWQIQRIRSILEECYAEDIKLADLAAVVGWSQFYLLRAFRREVGLPPHAYLENIRVRQAQRLLAAGISISQTAYEVGFSSQSHFTTTFKRLISVTPGQYAKQINL
jgi:AraC-like DNA-binding protein